MDIQDRELLELAAKAAGVDVVGFGAPGVATGKNGSVLIGFWNPLTNDGDALRLAVKLQLSVCNEHVSCGAAYCTDLSEMTFPSVDSGSSESFVIDADYAATRRAIVLAAAQIGRAMP